MTTPDIAEARRTIVDLKAWVQAYCNTDTADTINPIFALANAQAAELERLRAQVAQSADALRLMLRGTQADCGRITIPSDEAVRAAFAALATSPAAPAQQAEPLMLNGLTESETSATASVAGLVGERSSPAAWVSRDALDWIASPERTPLASIMTNLYKTDQYSEGVPVYLAAPSSTVGEREAYCLACDKPGHLTTECHSTHGLNTPAARELFRLIRTASQPAAQAEPVAWCKPGPDGRPWFGKGWQFSPIETAEATMPLGPASSNPPAQGVEDERAAFEAWAAADAGNITRHKDNAERYASATVQGWWRAWQARAALAQAQKEQQ